MADLIKDHTYVNPELRKILQSEPPKGNLDATTDIYALRELLAKRKKELTDVHGSSDDALITEEDHLVPTRDGAHITVRVYRTTNQQDTGPIIVMLHGGGWVLGGLDNEALLCRQWCQRYSGVSVNVEYRLAPEHKFPTAVYDSHDAVKWTAAHAATIGGDPRSGFIVAGVSAGASMAAAISHLYRDEQAQPPLTGIYLSIPSLVSPEAVAEKYKPLYSSRVDNANALILNDASMGLFRKLYEDDPHSPLMSPLNFPSGHRGLPPTYLQVCGSDPLRDDGLLYEQVLREESGVKTRLDLYPGLPHGFWSWWPQAEFSKQHFRDSVQGLGWLLQQS
ncbi:hypothetical protein FE257_003090 [Aspergillus nanangensis]|uniref:Alpha/beta hydrolase fold-3 domain-containing protein n=1 Tax=Aspergillus nanangensis TaxID=2582783 RepID=A0AAD4CC04_ASPNN|nr:hypothetical protein FE257_003090 [Aspergillus nanangensis]